MEEFVSLLSTHLESYGLLKANKMPPTKKTNHKQRSIIKLTKRLAKVKTACRREFLSIPKQFLCSVRAHNKVKQAKDQYLELRATRKQERAFKQNPWKFAKSVCNSKQNLLPTFSMSTCYEYFKETYSEIEVTYTSGLPDWVSQVMPVPKIVEEFDLSAIAPHLIKRTLQKCPSKSSPGPDSIIYFHLTNLPSTHHFLATLFSKVLSNPTEAPAIWFSAVLKLISKNEDPS